jgi:WD40 repeat protein
VQAILDEEVQRLPEKLRAPFVLCCLEGKSKAEAARLLGWKEGTVSGRLAQARERLRDRLTRRGVSLPAALCALAVTGEATASMPAAVVTATTQAAIRFLASGGEGSSAILATQALQGMASGKIKATALVMLSLLAASAIGYQMPAGNTRSEDEARRQASVPETEQQWPRTDLYGDTLPVGALARLGSVRLRHAGWIERLAYSPDGKLFVSAGNEGVRLWESDSGRPVRLHGERADSVTFLDNGRRIAGGVDNHVVWNVADGKEIARLFILGGLHHSARAPNGKLLAGVGSDGALRLLDAATGEVLKQLDGHEDQLNERPKGAPPRVGQILSVAFSPEGKAIASACFQDSRVFIWDIASGKVRHTLPGHQQPQIVLFSPNGRLLAVGGGDQIIRLWDPATGRKLDELRGHVGGISGLAFSPDGSMLASGASGNPPNTKGQTATDSTVRLWDVKTGKARTLPGPERWAQTVAFSPDGKTLAVGGSGTRIHLIDVATGKQKHSHPGHDGTIFRVALSPDGKTLASGGEDNLIHLWDLRTSREKARLEGHQGHVAGLAFTPDGRELLSCGYDGMVRVWDWRDGKETRRFAETGGWHYSFDLSPDGKMLLLPTGQLWNIATGKQEGTVPNYKGLQYRAVFSPDGKRLTAPNGAIAVVVDVATGKEVCSFSGHEPVRDDRRGSNRPEVVCVAWSPDGRRAVSGGAEALAFIWDAATGKMQRRLQGHENPIIAVAFSPDGRMAATASGSMWNHKEQTVRLWEVTTGKERRRFVGHQAQITSIVFSRDGSTLISGSEDATALVWDVAGVLNGEIGKITDAEALWRSLAGEDAVVAYEAVCALTACRGVAFLTNHLQPVEVPDAGKIDRLLADLDSDIFATRQRAERELSQMEELAASALRKAAAEGASPEARRRAEALLAKLDVNAPRARTVQAVRAVEVLEHIATPEVRQLLEKLAAGAPEARLTREAKAALDRLQRRHPAP